MAGFLTPSQVDTGTVPATSRQRLSWCYGTPGVAQAQQLAGLALGDLERQRLAESAMVTGLCDLPLVDARTRRGLPS